MNEKLQKVCEEILQNETESKKFKELKTPEEMYAYFKEKVPNLSEEEFDSFIAEILEQYSDEQENSSKNVSDSLGKVAGGVMLNKLSKKMLSGVLALTSLLPVAASATNTKSDHNASSFSAFDEEFDREYESHSKSNGTFTKIKNWIKNHKLLTAGVTLAVIVASALTIRHFTKKDKEEIGKTQSAAYKQLEKSLLSAKTKEDILEAFQAYFDSILINDLNEVEAIIYDNFKVENLPGNLSELLQSNPNKAYEELEKIKITPKKEMSESEKEDLLKRIKKTQEKLKNFVVVCQQEMPQLIDKFTKKRLDLEVEGAFEAATEEYAKMMAENLKKVAVITVVVAKVLPIIAKH